MQPRLLKLIISFIFLSLITLPANAQTGRIVRLSEPDTSQFPVIQAYLDVHDASGVFVHDLQPDQVSITESGTNMPVISIEEFHPGVQVVVAINPGLAFAIRNPQAVSRYDQIKEELRSWANSRLGTSTDDWSLIIGQESEISHTNDPAVFLSGLAAAPADQRNTQASIDVLARAVNLASDQTPRPGMGRAVLFITSVIDSEIEQAIRDISNQAQQQEISISIWLVASRGAVMTQSTQQLFSLALNNRGQVFSFSGEETIPNPEEFLDPMRNLYLLSYGSKAGLDSAQQFWAEVQFEDELVRSNQLAFKVDLLPPLPAIVSPPILIERSLAVQVDDEKFNTDTNVNDSIDRLLPSEIALQAVFDFPDGRKRELVTSALLVDGVLVAENLAPPFDQFIWDLKSYISDSSVKIQVQCTDTMGLTGSSIELPVEISVVRPERDPWYVLRNNTWTVLFLLLLLLTGLIFLVLILGGKIRPFTQGSTQKESKKNRTKKPVIHPVNPIPIKKSGWTYRLQLVDTIPDLDAKAYLQPLEEKGNINQLAVIPINKKELLFGSDLSRNDILIQEPDIEPIHARLMVEPENEYWLFDMGSVGGTWVNYSSVSEKGIQLSSGDLIHFGRLGFMFSIRDKTTESKPIVIINDIQNSNHPLDSQIVNEEMT